MLWSGLGRSTFWLGYGEKISCFGVKYLFWLPRARLYIFQRSPYKYPVMSRVWMLSQCETRVVKRVMRLWHDAFVEISVWHVLLYQWMAKTVTADNIFSWPLSWKDKSTDIYQNKWNQTCHIKKNQWTDSFSQRHFKLQKQEKHKWNW